MWQPPSIPTVWPPGQVFALRPCVAAPILRVCGTIVVTAWRWPGGPIPAWTPTVSRSATTIIAVRCRPGPVLRAPRYVGADTPTSRNRTPPRRVSTNRRMLVCYGVVSSPTSLPIQPPRVRNLLVRALRATPRGEESPRNGGWWDVAHPSGGGGGGLRRDATTKRGLFQGPGRDLTWPGWGRIWPGGGVGMSRSRPPSKSTGWDGWDGRYRTPRASLPISPAASHDHNNATNATKAPAAKPASTSTGGRRLDEQLESRAQHSGGYPTGPVSVPNSATRPRQPIPVTAAKLRVVDQEQLVAALARLPAPLAAQLARLVTQRITDFKITNPRIVSKQNDQTETEQSQRHPRTVSHTRVLESTYETS